jgi:septum formation protein
MLAALGLEFDVVPPAIDEVQAGDPAELVLANARAKALAVAEQVGEPATVLGVDTDVAIDSRLLGKAGTEAEARERLDALSGRTHEVLSGLALLLPQPDQAYEERTAVETSRVTLASLDEGVLDLYLASGEWRDRAGAYAVQGLGSMLVDGVEGDVANVIGLPLRRLFALWPELAENIRPQG